jgi:hypothetical protein
VVKNIMRSYFFKSLYIAVFLIPPSNIQANDYFGMYDYDYHLYQDPADMTSFSYDNYYYDYTTPSYNDSSSTVYNPGYDLISAEHTYCDMGTSQGIYTCEAPQPQQPQPLQPQPSQPSQPPANITTATPCDANDKPAPASDFFQPDAFGGSVNDYLATCMGAETSGDGTFEDFWYPSGDTATLNVFYREYVNKHGSSNRRVTVESAYRYKCSQNKWVPIEGISNVSVRSDRPYEMSIAEHMDFYDPRNIQHLGDYPGFDSDHQTDPLLYVSDKIRKSECKAKYSFTIANDKLSVTSDVNGHESINGTFTEAGGTKSIPTLIKVHDNHKSGSYRVQLSSSYFDGASRQYYSVENASSDRWESQQYFFPGTNVLNIAKESFSNITLKFDGSIEFNHTAGSNNSNFITSKGSEVLYRGLPLNTSYSHSGLYELFSIVRPDTPFYAVEFTESKPETSSPEHFFKYEIKDYGVSTNYKIERDVYPADVSLNLAESLSEVDNEKIHAGLRAIREARSKRSKLLKIYRPLAWIFDRLN